mgnify:CR=1 FL=1
MVGTFGPYLDDADRQGWQGIALLLAIATGGSKEALCDMLTFVVSPAAALEVPL